jgi:hypothetical protein
MPNMLSNMLAMIRQTGQAKAQGADRDRMLGRTMCDAQQICAAH